MTIKYVAEDGTEFDTKEECIKHEIPRVTLEEKKDINKAIEIISHVCHKVKALNTCNVYEVCSACPFHYNVNQCGFINKTPLNWTYV